METDERKLFSTIRLFLTLLIIFFGILWFKNYIKEKQEEERKEILNELKKEDKEKYQSCQIKRNEFFKIASEVFKEKPDEINYYLGDCNDKDKMLLIEPHINGFARIGKCQYQITKEEKVYVRVITDKNSLKECISHLNPKITEIVIPVSAIPLYEIADIGFLKNYLESHGANLVSIERYKNNKLNIIIKYKGFTCSYIAYISKNKAYIGDDDNDYIVNLKNKTIRFNMVVEVNKDIDLKYPFVSNEDVCEEGIKILRNNYNLRLIYPYL